MNTTDAPIILAKPDGTPLPPDYLLSKNPRGKFVMKITLSWGKTFTGVRFTFQLRTSDPTIAMSKRDTIVDVFKAMGMIGRDVVVMEM